MRAFVFPGQGSQYVGMGRELAETFTQARYTFEEVDEALGKNLFRLMTEGDEDELNMTENTQPALMAVSMAVINVLTREAGIHPHKVTSFMAGHSLGEYSALTASAALNIWDTAQLLQTRGHAMQEAMPAGTGAMAAIMGLEMEAIHEIADTAAHESGRGIVCECANDNAPGQVVVSGHAAAVDLIHEKAEAQGAKKVVRLPVSAPFHCTLMAPAAKTMAQALADTDIHPPRVPIVSNVTARAESDPPRLRQLLVEQITQTVRWRESVQFMQEQGVTSIIEIGAGKVLSGLNRRIDRNIASMNVEKPEEVEALIDTLNKG